MATDDKRCGTCRHYRWKWESAGDCMAPVPLWIRSEGVVYDIYGDVVRDEVYREQVATDCPTWAAKDEKA